MGSLILQLRTVDFASGTQNRNCYPRSGAVNGSRGVDLDHHRGVWEDDDCTFDIIGDRFAEPKPFPPFPASKRKGVSSFMNIASKPSGHKGSDKSKPPSVKTWLHVLPG